jgi:actin-related protein 4
VPPTPSQLATPATANSRIYSDMVAIPQLVHEALTTCDVDVRASLLQNVVVVGGGSLLPGFVDRLNFELSVMFPGVRASVFSSHELGAFHS